MTNFVNEDNISCLLELINCDTISLILKIKDRIFYFTVISPFNKTFIIKEKLINNYHHDTHEIDEFI